MLVAGIDVGNATTEVVIADCSTVPPTPLGWDRAPTRGRKGSARALEAGVELLRRVERRVGVTANLIAFAPQHPVDTLSATVASPPVDTGRLAVLASGRPTPSGRGVGVGRPVDVELAPDAAAGPVVLVATDPLGYAVTAERVNSWLSAGAEVVGVLLAGDEAVLVSRRLRAPLPVLDLVDTSAALAALLIAVEVAEPGRPLRELGDPVRLAAMLGLTPAEHSHAEAVARSVRGSRDAAVALLAAPRARPLEGAVATVTAADGFTLDLLSHLARLRDGGATDVVHCRLPLPDGSLRDHEVADLWGVDLTALGERAVARPGAVNDRSVALALLAPPPTEATSQAGAMAALEALDRRFVWAGTEAEAALAGALTTPGAERSATVVDIGAGTIDVVGTSGVGTVLAGAGELLTVSVAELMGISRGQAEWVKRGPCERVEAPHVLVDESGLRRFADEPVPTGSVGWLVVPGPAGPLPFEQRLAPSEWRALRLTLKQELIGGNIRRAVSVGVGQSDVIVVGGPAGDDEVLDCVARALPGAIPGRGNVAGVLGHRWAVAYGLVVLATSLLADEEVSAHG